MDIGKLILNNSYMFACVYIMTDYVTSSYTKNGEIIFGVLCGLLTFGFYFINPIIAPYIAITIVSLFNNLIDRLCNKTTYK
jgi:Na+-translocating ferredoxin:NAD+ oxidoreductase RnfD subunit